MTEPKFDKCAFCGRSEKECGVLVGCETAAICEKCAANVVMALTNFISEMAFKVKTQKQAMPENNVTELFPKKDSIDEQL